jgi:glycosyltransferase involved in cell wall biosynthesis
MSTAFAAAGKVAFILKGYPRLSETFIAQEIRALEARGLDIVIVSLRRPNEAHRHPVHGEIRAPVRYLPEYLWREPRRVFRAWRRVRRWPAYARARAAWWRDLRRDPSSNRGRRFGQALVLAAELDPAVDRLHAHFIHTPGSVARYASLLTGRPWSCSAHARDIWTIPDWEKREKLAECAWAVTCSAAGAAHLAALAPPGKVELVYHGLDLGRFPPPAQPRRPRDGGDPRDPVIVLSVGRAVAKKGYDDLLAALARLPAGLHWRFVHVGGGVLAARLGRLAERLGIADRVTWLGARPQGEVLARYREADLFVLASRIAADGDRDGLPNVLMEAQSQGLACISTRLSAIPELVRDGESGLLVEPGDIAALGDAIAALARDPARRLKLGAAGAARVQAAFDMGGGIDRLAQLFGLEGAPRSAARAGGTP